MLSCPAGAACHDVDELIDVCDLYLFDRTFELHHVLACVFDPLLVCSFELLLAIAHSKCCVSPDMLDVSRACELTCFMLLSDFDAPSDRLPLPLCEACVEPARDDLYRFHAVLTLYCELYVDPDFH